MRLGVDLGGTKIEAVVLDASGTVSWRRRLPTPQGDYAGTLRCIETLVESAEAELGVRCTVGIATPGSISRQTGLLKNSNSVCLNGKPILQDLQLRLDRAVRIANDADCFALSEASDGAAADARVVFGVILGTGVGGGLVVDGALLGGPNGIAGEWGHNPLPWAKEDERPGPACYCGKSGCIETFLSGPGFADSSFRRRSERLNPQEIVALARGSDADAQAELHSYIDRLARALAHIINVLDPHVIVLGGGMSNIVELYDGVPQKWGHYVFSDDVRTRLVRACHGDSSGVRGAAWLWPAASSAGN